MRTHLKILCAVLILGLLAGCTGGGEPVPTTTPLSPVPVPLTVSDSMTKQTIRIGLLIAPLQGEGSEYRDIAEGARVGAYRFQMTGAKVEIVVGLDTGTVDGVKDAIAQLTSANVAGIIVASSGAHIRDAISQLEIAQPMLLPYDSLDAPIPGVWSTGPTSGMVSSGITTALASARVNKPFLVTGTGQADVSVSAAASQPFSADVAQDVVDALDAGTVDSLVVNASAMNQAQLVSAVQQALGSRQIPILLTPSALTPTFASGLLASGFPSSTLVSFGTNTSDPAALSSDSAGAHMSAFFTALKLAANDTSCLNVFGDAPFSQSARAADVTSQDAVIALVRAAEKAGSTSPGQVKQALQSMTVLPNDGLSGPALDFTNPSALSAQSVQPLYASSQDPGLRPQSDTSQPILVWFPRP